MAYFCPAEHHAALKADAATFIAGTKLCRGAMTDRYNHLIVRICAVCETTLAIADPESPPLEESEAA